MLGSRKIQVSYTLYMKYLLFRKKTDCYTLGENYKPVMNAKITNTRRVCMLVNPKELLKDAQQNNYAIAGINATTLEGGPAGT